jgi:hypothetical protein
MWGFEPQSLAAFWQIVFIGMGLPPLRQLPVTVCHRKARMIGQLHYISSLIGPQHQGLPLPLLASTPSAPWPIGLTLSWSEVPGPVLPAHLSPGQYWGWQVLPSCTFAGAPAGSLKSAMYEHPIKHRFELGPSWQVPSPDGAWPSCLELWAWAHGCPAWWGCTHLALHQARG